MKRLVLSFDGTWNTPDGNGDEDGNTNTNVRRLHEAALPGMLAVRSKRLGTIGASAPSGTTGSQVVLPVSACRGTSARATDISLSTTRMATRSTCSVSAAAPTRPAAWWA
jgi:hypothetical protein